MPEKPDQFFRSHPEYKNQLMSFGTPGNYISYNPEPERDGISALLNAAEGTEDEGGGETAMKYDGEWYIFRGDLRAEITEAMQTSGVSGVLLFLQPLIGSKSWLHQYSSGNHETIKKAIEEVDTSNV